MCNRYVLAFLVWGVSLRSGRVRHLPLDVHTACRIQRARCMDRGLQHFRLFPAASRGTISRCLDVKPVLLEHRTFRLQRHDFGVLRNQHRRRCALGCVLSSAIRAVHVSNLFDNQFQRDQFSAEVRTRRGRRSDSLLHVPLSSVGAARDWRC